MTLINIFMRTLPWLAALLFHQGQGQPEQITRSPSSNSNTTWQGGNFAVLKTSQGCPWGDLPSVNLQWSSRMFIGAYYDDRRNILSFCEVTLKDDVDVTPSRWPDGQYCINRLVGFSCPEGFSNGTIPYYNSWNHFIGQKGNVVYQINSYTRSMDFCCRNTTTGPDSTSFPTDDAFILYKYGASCAQFPGLTASDNRITFWYINEDSSEGSVPEHGKFPRSYLDYCYYEPSSA